MPYSPESIVLGVSPAGALAPFLPAAQTAPLEATGRTGTRDPAAGRAPHLTIGYSIGEQPAAPVIAALGTRLPPCEVTVDPAQPCRPERPGEPVGLAR